MLQIHGESLKVLKFGMFTKCLPIADPPKKNGESVTCASSINGVMHLANRMKVNLKSKRGNKKAPYTYLHNYSFATCETLRSELGKPEYIEI